jgi:hypothetical protein
MENFLVWIIASYVIGSIATYFLLWKKNTADAVGATIDSLIANGFLRAEKKENGEVEILKCNDSKDAEL